MPSNFINSDFRLKQLMKPLAQCKILLRSLQDHPLLSVNIPEIKHLHCARAPSTHLQRGHAAPGMDGKVEKGENPSVCCVSALNESSLCRCAQRASENIPSLQREEGKADWQKHRGWTGSSGDHLVQLPRSSRVSQVFPLQLWVGRNTHSQEDKEQSTD